MRISIIGLGLIGGSMARRLRGFHNCTIAAYNRTRESLDIAISDGVIDEAYDNPGDAMEDADIIIISPTEKMISPLPVFIAAIPENPIIAPIILKILNFSSFINKKAKKI